MDSSFLAFSLNNASNFFLTSRPTIPFSTQNVPYTESNSDNNINNNFHNNNVNNNFHNNNNNNNNFIDDFLAYNNNIKNNYSNDTSSTYSSFSVFSQTLTTSSQSTATSFDATHVFSRTFDTPLDGALEADDDEECLKERYWYAFLCSSLVTFGTGLSLILLGRLVSWCCWKDAGAKEVKRTSEVQVGWVTEAKDWSGELISGQTTTGRILVGGCLKFLGQLI